LLTAFSLKDEKNCWWLHFEMWGGGKERTRGGKRTTKIKKKKGTPEECASGSFGRMDQTPTAPGCSVIVEGRMIVFLRERQNKPGVEGV